MELKRVSGVGLREGECRKCGHRYRPGRRVFAEPREGLVRRLFPADTDRIS